MKIRPSVPEDLPAIMAIYDYAHVFMREHGNPTQWPASYPSEEFIREEMAKGHSFVCEGLPDSDGIVDDASLPYHAERHPEILGTFCFIIGDDPTYQLIEDGQWLNDDLYGTVHRIASSGKRKGIAEAAIKWCFTQCPNIRIDTHSDNIVMQNLLSKSGFTRCGIIYTDNGTPRIAYQKGGGL